MIRDNRGVALATLVIAVLVMLTITGTIAYTSTDTIKLRKLDDMYNDIRLLNQKVANYYVENNSLPILGDVILKNQLPEGIANNNINDRDNYYIIDLEKLGGISLKYGKEYKEYSTNNTNNDVYIINELSQTIYYLKGITIKGITRYSLEENYSQIRLPLLGIEYQEVEYIESTGAQYIITDFIPNQDTRVVVDYQYTALSGSFLYGVRGNVNKNAYTVNIASADLGNVTAYGDSGNVKYAEGDTDRHIIDKNKNLIYLDNKLVLTQDYKVFTAPGYLEIFATGDWQGEGYLKSSAKIYSFKIYDNDVLVRDLVPCYRKSDKKPGLYDIVNYGFYTNSGTEEFLLGNDVNA